MLSTHTEETVNEEILARLSGYQDPSTPLPSTRDLGKVLGLSHVTVSKALRVMSDRGDLWRSENGRYYPKSARFIFDAPKPVVCFLRSISTWAGCYAELMEGIGQACEETGRGMLLHSAGALLDQPSALTSPRVLPIDEQINLLESLILRAQVNGQRLILDDLWDDRALAAHAAKLEGARVLLRPCSVPELDSLSPNYAQGALLALSHLMARGYEKIWLVRPFRGEVMDTMIAAFEEAAQSIGIHANALEVVEGGPDGTPAHVLRRLRHEKKRVGIYCTEENFSIDLYHALQSEGVAIPEKVGLMAGWGTVNVNSLGLSSLKIDLRHLGALAVNLDDAALTPWRPLVDFSLHTASST